MMTKQQNGGGYSGPMRVLGSAVVLWVNLAESAIIFEVQGTVLKQGTRGS